MKKLLALCLCVVFFAGCSHGDSQVSKGIALREKLLTAKGCTFQTVVTADFGDNTYSFTMDCKADTDGNLSFTVIEPSSISGISGSIRNDGGKLTFDDKALAFSLLADGELSPVSAPWILLKTLRGGYLKAGGTEGELCRLTIDDSYEQDALQLDVWLDSGDIPVRGEIVWQGRRILSLEIDHFTIL